MSDLHGFGVELGGVDASGGDFGFGVAFGAGGGDASRCGGCASKCGEGGVGPVGGWVEGEPALGEAGGEDGAEKIVAALRSRRGSVDGGKDLRRAADWWERGGEHGSMTLRSGARSRWMGSPGLPVGGDLQDGGAAEAAVGDEDLFAEGGWGGAGALGALAVAMTSAERPVRSHQRALFCGVEDERDERGAGGDDVEAELVGDLVAEGGGAHLGDGEAAGGDDDGVGVEGAGGGLDAEVRRRCVTEMMRVPRRVWTLACGALALEHGDDVVGGAVAEELAEGFFVVGDAVLFDEGDDVGWGVAGEGGLGEVGVFGEEVFGAGVEVGEVAAASAGDEDFFAGLSAWSRGGRGGCGGRLRWRT